MILTVLRRVAVRGDGESEVWAIVECAVPDVLDAARNDDGGQAAAGGKCIMPDAFDAVRDGDGGQAGAGIKRMIPDARDAVRDGDVGQAVTARERPVPDACDAVPDRDGLQLVAVVERKIPDDLSFLRDRIRGAGQPAGITQQTIVRLAEQHAVFYCQVRMIRRDMDRGQAHTTGEWVRADARHAVGDGDGGQAVAAVERPIPDARDAVRDRDGGQAVGGTERLIPDDLSSQRDRIRGGRQPTRIAHQTIVRLAEQHAVNHRQVWVIRRDMDRGQALTTGEWVCANARHAVRDGDRGHTDAVEERPIPDARDWMPVQGIRDHDFSVFAEITRNTRAAVVQDDVLVLEIPVDVKLRRSGLLCRSRGCTRHPQQHYGRQSQHGESDCLSHGEASL